MSTDPTLYELFLSRDDRDCHKWHHYFEVYERYLSPFRKKESCTILEIGVQKGGSLRLWKEYFGAKVRLYGIDVDPSCKQLQKEGFHVFIGDQTDAKFMTDLMKRIGPIDILIDDGGHTTDQQIMTFLMLFPLVKDGGVYIVEDVHSNFWPGYNTSRFGINFYDFAANFKVQG